MKFLKSLLTDLVKLRLPVTAAAVVATVLALVEPFGVSLGGDTTAKITAALVAIGVIAEFISTRIASYEPARPSQLP
jgi:hypothetical protein